MCVPWELNPQHFALLMQCFTTEPQELYDVDHHLWSTQSADGCHVMTEIMRFYIILPTSVQKNLLRCKTPVDSIGNIFQDLKRDILNCVSLSSGH